MSRMTRRVAVLAEPSAQAGYDTDAEAAFAAMTVQPDAGRKALYSDMIAGLKADGVWPLLDWLTLLPAHDAQSGRLNLRNPGKSLSSVNSPTFTADRGIQGDGSSSYVSYGEAFNAAGNQYATNSAMLGVWINAQGAATGNHPLIGSSQSSRAYIVPSTSGAGFIRMNDAVSMNIGSAESMLGSRIITRAGANERAYYRNGVLSQSDTAVSSVPPTGPAYLLRNGTANCDDRVAAAATGASLTATQTQALESRVTAFLSAIGAT